MISSFPLPPILAALPIVNREVVEERGGGGEEEGCGGGGVEEWRGLREWRGWVGGGCHVSPIYLFSLFEQQTNKIKNII